jgi:putative transcriptional regulator
MSEVDYLSNHILIAMPSLPDPEFYKTVVLICQHNQEGAMGVVLNRPSDLNLTHLFKFIGIENQAREGEAERWDKFESTPVYLGGPVSRERGFVLHPTESDVSPWASSMRISSDLTLTSSRDILEAISKGEGPEKYLISLGYSMWGPEQLEDELRDNDWLTGPVPIDLVFDMEPEKFWEAAAESMGINLIFLQEKPGHA